MNSSTSFLQYKFDSILKFLGYCRVIWNDRIILMNNLSNVFE